jgi:hypothetical protein
VIDIGPPVQRPGEEARQRGEFRIAVLDAAWRVQRDDVVVAGSHDETAELEDALRQIVGQPVTGIATDPISLELTLELGALSVRAFPTFVGDPGTVSDERLPAWRIWLPDGLIISGLSQRSAVPLDESPAWPDVPVRSEVAALEPLSEVLGSMVELTRLKGGSFLLLDFAGAPGAVLWVCMAPWRIDSIHGPVVGSENGHPAIREILDALVGRRLRDVRSDPVTLDTVFDFGDLRLLVFPVRFAGPDADDLHWLFRTPSGVTVSAGPRSTWSVESASDVGVQQQLNYIESLAES